MDKRKVTLSVIAIAVLLVVLVGSTYAYWTLNGPAQTSANVQVQTGGLILRLDDTEGSITTNDVIDPNHLSFSKYFNITNESAADGYAKILFKGLTNTFVTDALVYDLEEVQANKTSFSEPRMIITNEVVPKVSNTNATLVDGLLIEKGTLNGNTVTPNTKYYKITVRYKYSDTVNQSEDLNKTLVSGFTIEEGQTSVSMTVSFNTMDNSITNPESKTVTLGQTYSNLPVLTKEGYRLEGWYTDSLLTEKVEASSNVLKNGNHTLYAKWKESKFECLDEDNNEIICPSPLTVGTRIAIRNIENVQTFRYLRTTDSTSMLNECGTTSDIACTDTDSRNNIGTNKLRLLAEYNLKRTGTASSNTAIASNTLQDPNDSPRTNSVEYSSSNSNYNQSYIKTYINNYATVLNDVIGLTNVIKANALTKQELQSLFNCQSFSACPDTPSWIRNSYYWTGSPREEQSVWIIYKENEVLSSDYPYQANYYGVRPVIMIDKDIL